MSKKSKNRDDLPFFDVVERPTRKFGEIPDDCRLHLKEEYIREYMNLLSGVKTKGYNVAIEYTFLKGKVETNKSEKIFSKFEQQLLDILSPVMDYCESVNMEVERK